MKLVLHDLEKKFNEKRIENLKTQFRSFTLGFGQSWDHIPVVPVHLQAAYVSQLPRNKDAQQQLYESSHIALLQTEIVKSVKENGKFYRIKNFIDIIDNPMLLYMEMLLEQSNETRSDAKVILNKKSKLEEWKKKFHHESTEKIMSFITNIKSAL